MKERITMNSQALQAKFPEIYREFFSKCPIVVSAPGNFFWTGEYSSLFGGLAIKQNLPIRVYIGLEFSSFPENTIGEIKHFVPSRGRYENWKIPALMENNFLRLLNDLLNKEQIKTNFKIRMLSEFPSGCGLSASSAFASALITVLFLEAKKISLNDLEEWANVPVRELKNNLSFNSVFQLARQVETTATPLHSSGVGSFSSLVSSSFPVIYFRNNAEYWALTLKDLSPSLDLNTLPDWPIDFGLIYSGDAAGPAESPIMSIEKHLKQSSKAWSEVLKVLKVPKDQKKDLPLKAKISFAQGPYIKALAAVSLDVLCGLNRILSEGTSEAGLRYLFQAIKTNHKLLDSLNVSSVLLDEICFLIDKKVRVLGDSLGAGCKLTGRGNKGDILFVVNWHGLRDQIDNLIGELREATKENIWLDYASWIDGFEENGVKVEQFLAKGIYSRFISEGSISLKSFTEEGAVQTQLTSLEKFEKEMPKIDLLLDAIEGNVYIRGQKLTSKEMHSSSATIEILSILLDNLGKNISDSKLSESSYSLDRNQMQSKIISPLTRVIKKRIKKNLPLKITGGIADFKIKLEPSDINIKVLHQVF